MNIAYIIYKYIFIKTRQLLKVVNNITILEYKLNVKS